MARLGGLGRRWRRGTLRGRRGTWRHPPSFHVAGVALGGIYLGFAWQAWHLWHWAGSGCALGRAWSSVTPRHFAWQAWHLAASTFVSRGRHGTCRHLPWFCVAGVALMALGWLWWRAWAGLVAGDAAALCMAGVALDDIHLRFAWSTTIFHTTLSHTIFHPQLCHTPSFTHNFVTRHLSQHFAWQAWHLVASNGMPFAWQACTWRHPLWFCATICAAHYWKKLTHMHTHIHTYIPYHTRPDQTRPDRHTYIHTHIHTYIHIYIYTYIRTDIHTHTTLSHTTVSPPPLSFLPSPSQLQPLVLIIGRS